MLRFRAIQLTTPIEQSHRWHNNFQKVAAISIGMNINYNWQSETGAVDVLYQGSDPEVEVSGAMRRAESSSLKRHVLIGNCIIVLCGIMYMQQMQN